jgi:hypothetical protein
MTSYIDSAAIKLICAAALLLNAGIGLSKGRALMFYKTVERSQEPGAFWFAVAISVAGGLLLIIASILPF